MKRYSKAVVNLTIVFVLFLLIIWLLPKALVFFSPCVVGWIIALIAGPLDALVHEHFGISQVVELRLLLYLIICRQAEHVAVRTLEDL